MPLYAAFDLHSTSSELGVITEEGSRIYRKRVPNDIETVSEVLSPFKDEIAGIAVESTYNWYWLVDALMEEGYLLHLANPAAIQQYGGLKHKDDTSDAFWLAEMLRLGILPEGYIYPKEERPLRDLLRKRGHLVRLRTSLIVSLQHIVSRSCGTRISVNEIKRLNEDCIDLRLGHNTDLALAGSVSKETIDFLTEKIKSIEKTVEQRVKLKEQYRYLPTIPGVGKILSLTIMLETGPISRFPKVGDYASYCRKVSSRWISNGKAKGKGNQKNGNKYLAWAFSEAAEFARRYDSLARSYYNRKRAKTNLMVAHNALSHKLVRAAYYIMKDQVPFESEKLFA
jgi:transposase